eukprot:2918996-Pleurochrysis_carterae.AAC.1
MSSQRQHRCFNVAVVAACTAPLPSLLVRRCRRCRLHSLAVAVLCRTLSWSPSAQLCRCRCLQGVAESPPAQLRCHRYLHSAAVAGCTALSASMSSNHSATVADSTALTLPLPLAAQRC